MYRLHALLFFILIQPILSYGSNMNQIIELNIDKQEVDTLVSQSLNTFQIPGVAIGIIANNKILLSKGYGFCSLDERSPITAETPFPIGSCTKAFTTLALSQLVEKGLISWNDPVKKHLPEFTLKDEYATRYSTIKDLATHRTGMPRHDLIWYQSIFSPKQILERLKYLDLSYGFRNEFSYNNLMYIALGTLIEKVTNMTWEDYIKTSILKPLNLDQTGFLSQINSTKQKQFPAGYSLYKNTPYRIPYFNQASVHAAGSIYAPLSDMIKWLQTLLSKDPKIVNKNSLEELQTLQIAKTNFPNGNLHLLGYGLGWAIGSYDGEYLVWHDGSIDGFFSQISILPHKGIGVIILCNNAYTGSLFSMGITNSIFDLLLKKSNQMNWVNICKTVLDQETMQIEKEEQPLDKTSFSDHLSSSKSIIGTYSHPAYGEVVIELKKGKICANYHGLITPLHSLDSLTFIGLETPYEINPFGNLEFKFNPKDQTLSIQIDEFISPISFTKKSENIRN